MKFQKVIEQDFNEQMKNNFLFSEGTLNFVEYFSNSIASIYMEEDEYTLFHPDRWEFLKSPNGFIFASPNIPSDYKVEYISKLNHSQELVLPYIIGYAATLIWLSNVTIKSYNDNDVISNIAAFNAHKNGMQGIDFDLFSKEEILSLNRILD